jgi:hypothetical protein
MAVAQYLYGDTRPVIAPVLTAQGVAGGDVVGLSSGNVVRAEDTTWNTDLATTQSDFVLLFLGVSGQRKTAAVARVDGNGADNVIRVDADGVWEFDCASASFAVGDLVGMAKQTGNALESQKVVAVATEARAIGRVAEKGTSVTRVKVKLLSVKMPAGRQS